MWWKKAIGYQIYPSSFKDSNGDGIGDIPGILEKLDYLQDLGINLLWIGPFFASPMDDNGYDISNHRAVHPDFGKQEDIEKLIEACHARGIRIICDLVLNHTSDEHPWFIESRKNNSDKKDYYIWKEGKKGQLPNNWSSFFADSAWAYDEEREAYYLHIFSKKMPDLNWENPDVRQELYQLALYWMEKGMDGFRMDAVSHLAKDTSFKNSAEPVNEAGLASAFKMFSNQERLFDYLQEIENQVFEGRDVVRIGEVGGEANLELARRFTDPEKSCFDMIFNFDHCWENDSYGNDRKEDQKFSANVDRLKSTFNRWDKAMKDRWLVYYWLNHDHPRVLSQYGDDQIYRNESAKMLCNSLYFLGGSIFIYQGEEIGMSNVGYTSLEDFKDVSAQNYIKATRERLSEEQMLKFLRRSSRINARTPMQWNNTKHAGFSTANPWLKVNDNYPEVNVERQLNDSDSILNHYKAMIQFRKDPELEKIILEGDLNFIHIKHKDLFVYEKVWGNKKLTVFSNFRNKTIRYNASIKDKTCILHNYPDFKFTKKTVTLRPYESFVVVEK